MNDDSRAVAENLDYTVSGYSASGASPTPVKSVPDIPEYLQDTYWWAYLHPKALKFFEREWMVNLILWGNMDRLTRAVIDDLDDIPFPSRDLVDDRDYKGLSHRKARPNAEMIITRGCPYRCTFCSQSIMPIKWRSRSPENVLAEWRHLVEDLGAEEIGVLDDSANIRVKRLEELGRTGSCMGSRLARAEKGRRAASHPGGDDVGSRR